MIRAGLALLLALAPTAAMAGPEEDAADVRCVVIGAEMSQDKDPDTSKGGSVILFYFLGRLDARSPTADLKALITQEATRMAAADKGRIATDCAAKVQARGKQLEALGG